VSTHGHRVVGPSHRDQVGTTPVWGPLARRPASTESVDAPRQLPPGLSALGLPTSLPTVQRLCRTPSGYTRVEDGGTPVAVAPGRRWPGDRVGGCVKKCVRPHPPYRGRGGVRPLGTALGVASKQPTGPRLRRVDRNAPQDTAPHHAGAGERFTNIATAKKGRAALPPLDTPVPWPTSSLRWGVSPWTRPPRREGARVRRGIRVCPTPVDVAAAAGASRCPIPGPWQTPRPPRRHG
jgi:hypothetical protein